MQGQQPIVPGGAAAPPAPPAQPVQSAAPVGGAGMAAGMAAGAAMAQPPAPAPAGPTVIQTDVGAKTGQNKCPKCGATEIALNKATGKLRCKFCRTEFDPVKAMAALGLDEDIRQLTGLVIGSGTQSIVPSTDDIVTLKCSSCGAEVVIDTQSSTQAKCHWCRNMLSMNQQVPNGAVPDMVLPFKLTKEEARAKIEGFVKKRKAFAHPRFKAEFTTENIMGVYLPYMVVDANARCRMSGQGERLVRSYMVSAGRSSRRVYDADLYNVAREFDVLVDDLVVESSAEKLKQDASINTNNIINSIMPFDVKESRKYDSNYMRGFTSQKRDVNIEDLAPVVKQQLQDVARHRLNSEMSFYDRGIRWDSETMNFKGQRWVSAYFPVWLYSYYEKRKNGKNLLHYVAVNGRTGKTMGSVPICQPRLIGASVLVQLAAIALIILFFWAIF